MKLVRYGPVGHEKPGMLGGDGYVRDISNLVDDISAATLSPGQLQQLREIDIDDLKKIEGIPQLDFRLGACVGNVGKFIGIGLNYLDHAEEIQVSLPDEPIIFCTWTSSITGPDDDTVLPPNSEATDWEVELGIVIGAGGRHIPEEDALASIAGFCLLNDISEREYQIERCGAWDKGKGYDTFGPIGPWMVTPEELGNLDDLSIWLEVNGVRYQDSNTGLMAFKVPFLISYCSRFMSLQPGDIIATGTPAGVGMGLDPPVYLKETDQVRLGISGLGTQTHTVVKSPINFRNQV